MDAQKQSFSGQKIKFKNLPPMFYTGVTEETGELLTKMSDEVVHLGKVIAEKSGADMSQVDVILVLALFSSSIFFYTSP